MTCASSQHGVWIARASIPKEKCKSTWHFYNVPSDVVQCSKCDYLCIIWIEAIKFCPASRWGNIVPTTWDERQCHVKRECRGCGYSSVVACLQRAWDPRLHLRHCPKNKTKVTKKHVEWNTMYYIWKIPFAARLWSLILKMYFIAKFCLFPSLTLIRILRNCLCYLAPYHSLSLLSLFFLSLPPFHLLTLLSSPSLSSLFVSLSQLHLVSERKVHYEISYKIKRNITKGKPWEKLVEYMILCCECLYTP